MVQKPSTKIFKSKYSTLPGSNHDEVIRRAHREHNAIKRRTKRQPYVRSRYFNKDKIFLNIFWNHLVQKRRGEQTARAKLYLCAIDLLRNTPHDPESIFSYERPNEILHRFFGNTSDGIMFYVQVRQNKKTGRKDFMSVFPAKVKKNK
ncbi:MAG: hypothetical protein AAB541_02805 [Patescibacteria group bacterium]